MKHKIFIISSLILISVFNIVFGKSIMPIWAVILVESISIFLLIGFSIIHLRRVKADFEIQISKLANSLDEQSELFKSILNQQRNDIIDAISNNSQQLSEKAREIANQLSKNITEANNDIQDKIVTANTMLSDIIKSYSDGTISTIKTAAESAKETTNKCYENVCKLSNEHHEVFLNKNEILYQQGQSIQENIRSSVSDLSTKSNDLGESMKLASNEIKEKINSSDAKMSEFVTTSINTMNTSLDASINIVNKKSNEAVEFLRHLANEQHQALLQRVDSVTLQGMEIQEDIRSSVSNLSSKSDAVGEAITLASNEIKNQISSADKILLNIERQNSSIVEQVASKVKDYCVPDTALSNIKKQCETLNKNVTAIQVKAQNIEDAIYLISEDGSTSKITESIASLIAELKSSFKSSVSELSNSLLDTQISQETTNNELEKLQILLRTVLKSFDEKTGQIVSEVPKAVKNVVEKQKPAPKTGSVSAPAPKFQPKVTQTQAPVTKPISTAKDPNRSETIVDNETQNIVANQYKEGRIVKSTMKDNKGHTLYELEYVNGRIVRSRNYNNKGQLTVEQTFYDNGQVHYRNEYTSNGKITTEFDQQGKRK